MIQQKLNCLNKLREKYKDLLEKYQPVVLGEGNPDADILLVGEAPGRHEVDKGRPFVGQAGKNLDDFLEALELKRENLYITNAVKFRPTRKNASTGRVSNRAPTRKEVEQFRSILMEEIEMVNPGVVVTLGNTSLFAVTGENQKIGDVHGQPIYFHKKTLFPLYHPASIIYRRELEKTYYEDLQKLKILLNSITSV